MKNDLDPLLFYHKYIFFAFPSHLSDSNSVNISLAVGGEKHHLVVVKMSGRPATKTKTKEDGDLVDMNPRPHFEEYQKQKNVQRGVERLERHPARGYLGLPSKKGHGGKYTWEGPEQDGLVDLPPDAIDEGDPNYIDEAQQGEGENEELVKGVVEVAKAPVAPQGVARVEVVPTPTHSNPTS